MINDERTNPILLTFSIPIPQKRNENPIPLKIAIPPKKGVFFSCAARSLGLIYKRLSLENKIILGIIKYVKSEAVRKPKNVNESHINDNH